MEDSTSEFNPKSLISKTDTEERWTLLTPLSSPSCDGGMESALSPEIFEPEYKFHSPLHFDTENFSGRPKFRLVPKVPSPKDGDAAAPATTNNTFSDDAYFEDKMGIIQYENDKVSNIYTGKDLSSENNVIVAFENNLNLDKNKDDGINFFKKCRDQKSETVTTNEQSRVSSEIQSVTGVIECVEKVTSIDTETAFEIVPENSEAIQKATTSEFQSATEQNIKDSKNRGKNNEENLDIGNTSSNTETALQNINVIYGNITVSEIYEPEVTNKHSTTNSEMKDINNKGNICYEKIPSTEKTFKTNNEQNIINPEVRHNNEKNACIDNISSTGMERDSEITTELFKVIRDSANSGHETLHEKTIVNNNKYVDNILSANMKAICENFFQSFKSQAIEKFETTNEQNIINVEMEMQNNSKEGSRHVENAVNTEKANEFEITTEKAVTLKDSVNSDFKIINEENIMESKTQDDSERNISIVNIISNDKETASGNFVKNSETMSQEKQNHSIKEAINMNKNHEKEPYQEILSHSFQVTENMDTDCESELSKTKNNVCLSCCNCKNFNFGSIANELESEIITECTEQQPVINLKSFLDLFDIDNSLSKTILSALSTEFKEKGVTQTELLNYLREKKFPGKITKLKQGIQAFFTAASGANIIHKKYKRQFLNVTLFREQMDIQDKRFAIITRKHKIEYDWENVQGLSKGTRSEKSESDIHSSAGTENKSKVTKNEGIKKDAQIKIPKLAINQDLPGFECTKSVKNTIEKDNSKSEVLSLQTEDDKSGIERNTVKGPSRKRKISEVSEPLLKRRKMR